MGLRHPVLRRCIQENTSAQRGAQRRGASARRRHISQQPLPGDSTPVDAINTVAIIGGMKFTLACVDEGALAPSLPCATMQRLNQGCFPLFSNVRLAAPQLK